MTPIHQVSKRESLEEYAAVARTRKVNHDEEALLRQEMERQAALIRDKVGKVIIRAYRMTCNLGGE